MSTLFHPNERNNSTSLYAYTIVTHKYKINITEAKTNNTNGGKRTPLVKLIFHFYRQILLFPHKRIFHTANTTASAIKWYCPCINNNNQTPPTPIESNQKKKRKKKKDRREKKNRRENHPHIESKDHRHSLIQYLFSKSFREEAMPRCVAANKFRNCSARIHSGRDKLCHTNPAARRKENERLSNNLFHFKFIFVIPISYGIDAGDILPYQFCRMFLISGIHL